MFVPFISERSKDHLKKLYRRKGGGGGGKSGGGSTSSGGGSGKSVPINSGGTTKSATAYGAGGGPVVTIPSGQFFAGRTSGGGTRGQVYGTSQYGSGYPGTAGRGVASRGFPFVFWPLAWGGAGGAAAGAYLHSSEYGRPNNSSRPGGPLATAQFVSVSGNSTFRLLADNATVTELIPDIRTNCTGNLDLSKTSQTTSPPSSYQDSFSELPQPEQTIQYYRASSVALTLDGYNNSAVFGPDGTPDTPLPSNVERDLLNCLNSTIGAAVPLIGGADSRRPELALQSMALFWLIWIVTSMI